MDEIVGGRDPYRSEVLNMTLLLGELVHAIGRRGRESKFSDLNVHAALVSMNIADPMDVAVTDPNLANRVDTRPDGTKEYNRVASTVYHEYLRWVCGDPSYKLGSKPPRGIKNKFKTPK